MILGHGYLAGAAVVWQCAAAVHDLDLRREEASNVEEAMGRKFIDCRAFPSEMNCTIALSADGEAELLEAAVQHAVAVHKHQDTPDLRQMIKSAMQDGTPPIAPPRRSA
jgi:predicted small metal-binding protein